MTESMPNQTPPIIQSPGQIPEKFLSGSIILCEKISREANSNNLSILGAFTGINIEYVSDDPVKMLETTSQIPIPPVQIFARLFSIGHQEIPWRMYARILSINDIPQDKGGFLNAEGIIQTGSLGMRQGDIHLPFPGIKLHLTTERKASIKDDGKIHITVAFELWSGATFLVAQTLDLRYNPKQVPSDAHGNDSTTRGAR